MKCRWPYLAIALLLAISPTTFGDPSEDQQRNHLRALHSGTAKPTHLEPLDRAYLDAYETLNQPKCGEFFGGNSSQHVLDEFVIRLRTKMLGDRRLGLRMGGAYTMHVATSAGPSYRLFEKAEINSIGPFYRSKTFDLSQSVPNIGHFQPNTRGARALMLLHELAHLIQGRDGRWLIPDDGNNSDRSYQNTLIIEGKCGRQIRDFVSGNSNSDNER